MKKLIYFICMITLSAFTTTAEAKTKIKIESPRGGFTTKRIQTIKGSISGFKGTRALLVINGIPQSIPVTGGNFKLNMVSAPGNNVIEVKAGRASDSVSFFAKVPTKDIKILLTWDTPTDVDLWVIDPTGEKCYYAHKSTSTGGNLDVDVISGYGPETFTMTKSIPGNYNVQVQYFSSKKSPLTNVNLYVIINEGTPKEQRKHYKFVMTKEHQVYHITNFLIDK